MVMIQFIKILKACWPVGVVVKSKLVLEFHFISQDYHEEYAIAFFCFCFCFVAVSSIGHTVNARSALGVFAALLLLCDKGILPTLDISEKATSGHFPLSCPI